MEALAQCALALAPFGAIGISLAMIGVRRLKRRRTINIQRGQPRVIPSDTGLILY